MGDTKPHNLSHVTQERNWLNTGDYTASHVMSRARAYCFTWNNYPPDYRTRLQAIDFRYCLAGEEVSPSTGTPHLQGYIYFASAKTVSRVRTLLPGCHVVPARGTPSQNIAYCKKTRPCDGNPNAVVFESGDPPMDPTQRGENERICWQNAWELAKLGRIEEVRADIRVRQYSSLRKIERDYMPTVERLSGPCGIWIYGQSGAGKTRAVLDQFPECYPKPRTIWWDGYQNEEVVLLDDLDKFDIKLGGKLKHWADAYPFIGESKGSSMKIRPKRIFVTSQYRIEDIWDDHQTRDALHRRFIVIEKFVNENIYLF